MLEDFNMKVFACRCVAVSLSRWPCVRSQKAPIQMVNVLHLCRTFLVLRPLKCFTPQVTLTPFIYCGRWGTVTQGAKPAITENCSSTHIHRPTAPSPAQLSILPKDIQTCGLEENCWFWVNLPFNTCKYSWYSYRYIILYFFLPIQNTKITDYLINWLLVF